MVPTYRDSDSLTKLDETQDIFSGPVGVLNGVARGYSGGTRVTQDGGEYHIAGTRFGEVVSCDLRDVVIASGRAFIDVQDTVAAPPLSIHRASGYTNISCGDRTIVILSGHSGLNTLEGFVASTNYDAADGTGYTVIVPEGRSTEEVSWVKRAIRVDQDSGSVTITKRKPAIGDKPANAIAGG